MELQMDTLRPEELATLKLRGLYERYGYKKYRMGRFEEYSLYAKNQSFLAGENIITFTDLDGKLLALKPDVTLSIIKNSKAAKEGREKLYYIESVYRESKESHTYREISQMGLEVMGDVDIYAVAEVLALAEQSLAQLSEDYLLEVSNMDFVTGLMSSMELTAGQTEEILRLIRSKNSLELRTAAQKAGLSEEESAALGALPSLYGTFPQTLARAEELARNETMQRAIDDLRAIYQAMEAMGLAEKLQLDFSLLNDIDYYNGVIFQGCLAQLPRNVLAGGQYDGMVRRLNKDCGGIGFAIYLSEMNRIALPQASCDVEALVLYESGSQLPQLLSAIQSLAGQGMRVRAETELPKQLRYQRLYRFAGGRLIPETAGGKEDAGC